MTPEQAEAWEKEKQERARNDAMMWNGIFRKAGNAIRGWRTCDVKECRRNRQCSSDTRACIDKRNREDPRVFTRAEISLGMSQFRKMLEQEMAKRGRDASAAGNAEAAMPRHKAGKR